jgi:hypothetical protein
MKLEKMQQKNLNAYAIVAGDFNLPLYEDECIARSFSKWEKNMADYILRNLELYNLKDSHRVAQQQKGTTHTFKRPGSGIFSTIDKIFTNFDSQQIVESSRNWGIIQSDHAMLKITIDLKNKTKRGPGLSKLNIRTLESETNVKTIRDEFEVLIKNAPGTWDPHTKLDYAKAVFSGITKALDKKTKFETKTKGELLKNELDQAHLLLERKFGTNNQVHSESQVKAKERLIRSISNIEKELEEFVNSRGEFLARLSRSKWYNEGEKSNKYFLNIMNYRESQKNITEIK